MKELEFRINLAEKQLEAKQKLDEKNNALLTPSEAKQLKVPYGTTKSEAAKKGIIPGGSTENNDYGNIKEQNKLEQQYRQTLLREVSSRSGGMGLEDQKVNQANHLSSVFNQYRDMNGNYNVPRVLYNELALGLARLLSPTGQVGIELMKELTQDTAYGGMNAILTYITGSPKNGTTQDVLKLMADTIDRQGQVAQQNRESYIGFLHGLAPTGLDPKRIERLERGSLNNYRGITGGFSITDPNGMTHTFKDQKSLDAFKKAAKL